MPEFTFDPEGHVYTVNGVALPSVTSVLPYNYRGNNEAAMLKGTYVHDMCRLYLLNNLDEDNLDPVLVPYLDAFKKFLNDSKGMGIEGVIDIKSGSPHPCVELQVPAYIELVNNGIPMSAPEGMPVLEMPFYHPVYQYAGTPDIIIYDKLPIFEGHGLYLKENGKYSLKPIEIENIRKNLEMFLQFLNTEKWKREKGLSDGN